MKRSPRFGSSAVGPCSHGSHRTPERQAQLARKASRLRDVDSFVLCSRAIAPALPREGRQLDVGFVEGGGNALLEESSMGCVAGSGARTDAVGVCFHSCFDHV
jgi:hypothetical protein